MSIAPLSVRVLASAEDQAAYLRLRAFRWNNPAVPLDLNAHDRFARAIGLFDRDGTLIAGVRLVLPGRESPWLPQLREAVAALAPESLAVLSSQPSKRTTLEESVDLSAQLAALEATGARFAEVSRLVSNGRHSEAGAVFRLIPFAIRRASEWGCDHVIAGLRPEHLRAWERYGFRRIEGADAVIERYTPG